MVRAHAAVFRCKTECHGYIEVIQGLHIDGNKRAASAPEVVSRNSNYHRNAHSLRCVNGDRSLD